MSHETYARSTDPATSHAAAASITDDELSGLQLLVLGALRTAGNVGHTVDELVDATGREKVTISPRLKPLCQKGLVYMSDERRPGKSGRPQIVWKASPAPQPTGD